jgi:hypothetical protein
MKKIHLKRSNYYSFCGIYQPEMLSIAVTDDFRKCTCESCIKSAHYWRNREDVARLATKGGDDDIP